MRPAALLGVSLLSMNLPAAAQPGPAPALDWTRIADKLVHQMALQPGERVLLLAAPGQFEALIPPLRLAVIRAGGVDLGSWTVLPLPLLAGQDAAVVEEGARRARPVLLELLRNVDVAVMMPGAIPAHGEYSAMQEVLKSGHGRTIHFHWHAFGTQSAMALPGHPLPTQEVIDATYERALLGADCKAIGEVQRRFAAAMRTGEVRITSPEGTDLRFRIGDRPVNFQDGDASAARARAAKVLVDREIELPCGVIRVAPLEETVDGTIAFPTAQWAGKTVEGLKLRFVHGKVTEVMATAGREAVEEELQKGGEAARAFREMGLGFNPELVVPDASPWIPYYGYGAGVVRLSLGNNEEVGGAVRGPYVRWNFFVDTTVSVGGQVWVKGGKLVLP
ncbi:MAG: aminopeptidase [Acidobacteriota bacterium]|nr:aminopeptidase [Acidobacteriota bacterium]